MQLGGSQIAAAAVEPEKGRQQGEKGATPAGGYVTVDYGETGVSEEDLAPPPDELGYVTSQNVCYMQNCIMAVSPSG